MKKINVRLIYILIAFVLTGCTECVVKMRIIDFSVELTKNRFYAGEILASTSQAYVTDSNGVETVLVEEGYCLKPYQTGIDTNTIGEKEIAYIYTSYPYNYYPNGDGWLESKAKYSVIKPQHVKEIELYVVPSSCWIKGSSIKDNRENGYLFFNVYMYLDGTDDVKNEKIELNYNSSWVSLEGIDESSDVGNYYLTVKYLGQEDGSVVSSNSVLVPVVNNYVYYSVSFYKEDGKTLITSYDLIPEETKLGVVPDYDVPGNKVEWTWTDPGKVEHTETYSSSELKDLQITKDMKFVAKLTSL